MFFLNIYIIGDAVGNFIGGSDDNTTTYNISTSRVIAKSTYIGVGLRQRQDKCRRGHNDVNLYCSQKAPKQMLLKG